jgi:hypothetical protein
MVKGAIPVKALERDLVDQAEEILRDYLARVPAVRIESMIREPSLGGIRPDILAKLSFPEGEQVLAAEVKRSGQPRAAREAVNQLRRYRETDPAAYGVFVAPYISPASAAICSEEGMGYADLAGNCRLSFGRVYIEREGRPNPFTERRDLRSLYSPKATRVLRVLLEDPKRAWKTMPLAREAKVSLGQVAKVKKLLVDREWVRIRTDGFSLTEPERLLTEWAENYTYRKNEPRNYYSLKSGVELEMQLVQACRKEGMQCALTAFSGAARWTPHVRYQRAFAYVGGALDKIAAGPGLKAVSSGANVTLLTPYDEGVFYGTREIDGVPVASPIQIYLDLMSIKGRGEEAAQALLEEVIRPRW